jgi:hypothetical protein
MPEELVPVGSFTATLAVKDAKVTDEVDRAGVSFGNIIKATGLAVAETQKKLNETGAETATALANTLVEVIAVQERVYDDLGNVSDGQTHVQNLPLVNFIDPVFYQWSQLRVQGLFYAGEFASATSATSMGGGVSTSASINFWGMKGSFAGNFGFTQVNTDADSDISYGNVRMNALLEPRADIGVPKPTQVIQGPRLSVIHGEIKDVHEGGDPTKRVISRTMEVLFEYRRRDGAPIVDKALSIDTPGVTWSYADPAKTKTDASGLRILLQRDFIDEKADTTAKDFVVTARIGIVQNATTVSF